MSEFIIAAIGFVGLLIGIFAGYSIRKQVAQARANSVEALAEKRLIEAKNKEQEVILKAKEKAITIIDEAKKEDDNRRREMRDIQSRLEKRESMFDQKFMEFEDRKTKLQQKVTEIQNIKERIDAAHEEAKQKLQDIAQYTPEQAKEELFVRIEQESKKDLMDRILKFDNANHDTLQEKAKDILIVAMQRTAANHASETTSTAVSLPSDEMKGRIIGKEGRNIKMIEKLTGCELIIDETPDIILISSFSPIRRRMCYLTLDKLIKDGRIQPAKIEEYFEEAKKELAIDIQKAGEEALHKMGIINMDPKLGAIVGRLKYRTSYGQNVLNHCLEVGYLAGIMAEEVGADPAKARKAGFFHDIGKAVDHETQGAHTEIGYTILKKFNIDEDTAQVALTHHDTNPPLLLTKLVMAADAISASRVGARRDTYEQYVARLEELENTVKDFPGVDKVYAIQAGREVRVFVNPNELDDYESYNLAKDIARRIESELQYPGEIKVNVIRETRVIEYAK
ncbi:MAG TPA: ribonuclease Y [Candidatus Magasanikbacteria bacterium]|nr:MAG: ribonuclease Y [Candidatus Magasanikbacteria bacterium RIFCSPLOWO2_02_FULL_47_16]OGH79927.1 MAG: ribonuclease Y [Candidatus Magasanikbacteria bacterium RIFCSPHIGHO2_02_FULL_48_18]OGH83503.1 MAG: ribonuclease Y [Candidatus Magasanikbacteria bacterium RIFCSPLOWO2_12_FULL_47_9b]HAZ28596.1 ribonuclease Y [Candidatus Magasanikbacteria bacterium]